MATKKVKEFIRVSRDEYPAEVTRAASRPSVQQPKQSVFRDVSNYASNVQELAVATEIVCREIVFDLIGEIPIDKPESPNHGPGTKGEIMDTLSIIGSCLSATKDILLAIQEDRRA